MTTVKVNSIIFCSKSLLESGKQQSAGGIFDLCILIVFLRVVVSSNLSHPRAFNALIRTYCVLIEYQQQQRHLKIMKMKQKCAK